MSSRLSSDLSGTSRPPFMASLEGFDGSKPFATIEVQDAVGGERLTIVCNTPEDFMAGWTRRSSLAGGEQQCWKNQWLFHSNVKPAVQFFNGDHAWYDFGLVSKMDGPALQFSGRGFYSLDGQLVPAE